MSPRRRTAQSRPPPATVTDAPLTVRFRDGSHETHAAGALAEFRGRLLVIARGLEIEAEYQKELVKGWRYGSPAPASPA